MKVILIHDTDAKALIDKLELVKMRNLDRWMDGMPGRDKLTDGERRMLFDMIHRVFHYEVVKWLQEQGATTT